MMQRLLAALAFAAALPAAAQALVAIVPVPGGYDDVAIDPTRNLVYVAAGSSNAVAIVDGTTRQVVSVPVGRRPQFLAVNTLTNRIYASNWDDFTLSVIDGATRAVTTLPIGGTGPIVVNERTNKIYVMRRGNNGEVTVVDGVTNTWYTMDTESYVPWSMALNPATNKLYVSHLASGDVRVIDLDSTSDHPPTVSVQIPGRPSWLTMDTRANKVYVQTDDATYAVVAIDMATNVATRIAAPGTGHSNTGITVNSATGRVYAGSNPQGIVIDGAANAVAGYIPLANLNHFVADPARNKIFALRDNHHVVVIDGATGAYTDLQLPSVTGSIALNPVTHLAYTAGSHIVDAGAASSLPPAQGNYQGLWWAAPAASESGWGLNIAHQGNTLFGAWFTYDDAGNAQWYVMPGLNWNGGEEYSGTIYRVTGPPHTGTFDPGKVVATVVGGASITFSDASNGNFSATVNGVRVVKPITRQVFGPLPTCGAGVAPGAQPNYTDIWWNSPAGSESGWGVFITHQGDNAFVVWYTYDVDGRGVWFVGNAVRNGGVYSGTFYRTTGPPFSASPWQGSRVAATPVGTLTLAFSDANNGSFSYSVNGTSGFKAITREAFASPATVCR